MILLIGMITLFGFLLRLHLFTQQSLIGFDASI